MKLIVWLGGLQNMAYRNQMFYLSEIAANMQSKLSTGKGLDIKFCLYQNNYYIFQFYISLREITFSFVELSKRNFVCNN